MEDQKTPTTTTVVRTEKRRYIRYELLDYAVLEIEAQYEPVSVVVSDIGLGGIQVRAKQELEVGTGCTIRIANDNGGEYNLPGEVRHCAHIPKTDLYAIGIRFTPMQHEERISVAEFVHAVFRRQAESLSL